MITYSEISTETAHLAREVVALIQNEGFDVCDAIHDYVDGNAYVIYYASAWDLVHYARTHDYDVYIDAEDTFTELVDDIKGLDDVITQMAYWVLFELVRRDVERLLDDSEV
jgi:hypothetical protein